MNPSRALATVLVGALVDLGVRHVVLCPGSRSAPLAYALADAAGRDELELHVRIDERSAAFVALGLARGAADGRPAAVVTTSGTAVANLHPAVLEASHGLVPLLVLSADRPHELRGTGANQTTDQVRIFGPAARWFAEIPAPGAGPGPTGAPAAGQMAGWRNVVARAVANAAGSLGGPPGPVQVNVAFADPLTPDADEAPADPGAGRRAGLTAVAAGTRPPGVRLPPGPATVVVAGDGAGAEAADLALTAGWPLLAEPTSGARTEGSIGPYRLLLERPGLGRETERVVVLGRPTLSRPVGALLARPEVEVVVVSRYPDWTDAGRRAALVVPAVSLDPSTPPDRTGWSDRWGAAGRVAVAAVDAVLDAEAGAGRMTGPLIAREVAAATRADDALVVGASNPARDLDLAAGVFPVGATVLANRGLAGIDGTLSTATGVALARVSAGRRGVVRCLVGDLTFLHDAGALLTGTLEARPQVQVVIVDDAGGGIFTTLEHGARAVGDPQRERVFERVFATPQAVDIGPLCAGYGVAHRVVDGPDELREALSGPPAGLSVLQVRVSRSTHRELAERLRRAVRTALEGPRLD